VQYYKISQNNEQNILLYSKFKVLLTYFLPLFSFPVIGSSTSNKKQTTLISVVSGTPLKRVCKCKNIILKN